MRHRWVRGFLAQQVLTGRDGARPVLDPATAAAHDVMSLDQLLTRASETSVDQLAHRRAAQAYVNLGDFEQAYSSLLGRSHAIAVANGTLALELALHAIGLESGDEVIVTPRSFVASASCVPLAGGIPVFADVDPRNYTIDPAAVEAAITPRSRSARGRLAILL